MATGVKGLLSQNVPELQRLETAAVPTDRDERRPRTWLRRTLLNRGFTLGPCCTAADFLRLAQRDPDVVGFLGPVRNRPGVGGLYALLVRDAIHGLWRYGRSDWLHKRVRTTRIPWPKLSGYGNYRGVRPLLRRGSGWPSTTAITSSEHKHHLDRLRRPKQLSDTLVHLYVDDPAVRLECLQNGVAIAPIWSYRTSSPDGKRLHALLEGHEVVLLPVIDNQVKHWALVILVPALRCAYVVNSRDDLEPSASYKITNEFKRLVDVLFTNGVPWRYRQWACHQQSKEKKDNDNTCGYRMLHHIRLLTTRRWWWISPAASQDLRAALVQPPDLAPVITDLQAMVNRLPRTTPSPAAAADQATSTTHTTGKSPEEAITI